MIKKHTPEYYRFMCSGAAQTTTIHRPNRRKSRRNKERFDTSVAMWLLGAFVLLVLAKGWDVAIWAIHAIGGAK